MQKLPHQSPKHCYTPQKTSQYLILLLCPYISFYPAPLYRKNSNTTLSYSVIPMLTPSPISIIVLVTYNATHNQLMSTSSHHTITRQYNDQDTIAVQ
jgi:hypothetical protein